MEIQTIVESLKLSFKKVTSNDILKKIVLIIPFIFVLELVLGFNGKLLMIGKLPIRNLLFLLTVIILVTMTIFAIRKNQLTFFDLKSDNSVFKIFDKLDYSIAIFLILNLIWVFIVPYFSHYGIKMAVKEVLSLTTIILYYPTIILIRLNYINWEETNKLIKRSLLILALIHIFFYVGEKYVKDATFVISIFKFIVKATNGHSQRPLVMLPDSYIRIIYPCSIFIILMFYYVIKSKLSKKDIGFYIVALTALFTTLTKSLILGIGVGLIFYIICCVIISRKYVGTFNYYNMCKLTIITVVFSIFINYALFDEYVFIRLSNTFATNKFNEEILVNKENTDVDKENLNADKELAGTKRANFTRINQTKNLLNKWSKSPLVGFGYGSYAEDYLRSDNVTPYSYEMLFPSMLMKIGILGMLVWLGFAIYIILYIVDKLDWKDKNTIAILYIIIALGIASEFNPFLFNSSGMSIVLFFFIELKLKSIEDCEQKCKHQDIESFAA